MNTSPQFHTPAQDPQEPLRDTHSWVSKLSAVVGVAAMINVAIPTPLSTSTRHLMDDTAGKAMTFMPPSPKAEVNALKSHNILVKYTIQPGDELGTLACVFWVTVENFMKYNPQIKRKDDIYAGDTLIVPNPTRNIAKCVGDNGVEIKKQIKVVQKTDQITQVATDTEEIHPLRTPWEARKVFLEDDDNVRLLVDYAKIYHSDDFNDIYWSKKISLNEKKRKLLKLYERDHVIFGKRPYIQAIRSAELDPHITKNTEIILKEAWYDSITAKDFLEAKTRIESSGWRFIESIKEAQELTEDYWRIQQRIEALKENHDNITDMGEMQMWRQDFAKQISLKSEVNKGIADNINKAVKQIVWDENDIWPHGITPGWVQNEMKKGWNPGCELKRIDDINHLRQEVIKIFAEAVKDNLSPEQIMKRLVALDSRFDEKLMWNAVLFSFNRTCDRLTKQWVSPKQATKQTHIIYNWRGPKAEKYAKKMHVTLGLMSAIKKAQSGTVAKNATPIKYKNRDIIAAEYGIDPKKVQIGKIERDPNTGTTLCSRTAHKWLIASGADPETVDQGDAKVLLRKWQREWKGIVFENQNTLKEYLLSQAKDFWKNLWDMTMNTPDGHRAYSFFGTDGRLYMPDQYRGNKKKPMLFDDYMAMNFGKSFTKVVVNTRVWKIVNPKAKFVVKQKQPTPISVIMASTSADTVPVMVQSDGILKISQGVSTSVVKLTDDTVWDNHLRTDADVGDNNKMLFPAATTSARIRNLIDYRIAQINILLSNVTDPVVKARIEKKLGENPAWTMTQNIKLQKKRYMKWWDVQALKNAKGLYALLVMCEQELAKIPAFNKMAA